MLRKGRGTSGHARISCWLIVGNEGMEKKMDTYCSIRGCIGGYYKDLFLHPLILTTGTSPPLRGAYSEIMGSYRWG